MPKAKKIQSPSKAWLRLRRSYISKIGISRNWRSRVRIRGSWCLMNKHLLGLEGIESIAHHWVSVRKFISSTKFLCSMKRSRMWLKSTVSVSTKCFTCLVVLSRISLSSMSSLVLLNSRMRNARRSKKSSKLSIKKLDLLTLLPL